MKSIPPLPSAWLRFFLCLPLLSAQVLPDSIDASRIELQLEDQAEHAPEGIDWTQAADIYEELLRQPVDLNRASEEELLRVPGMTPQLIRALRTHQARYGPLLSIYELQAIPGFTEQVYQTIRPYVKVRPATELDIDKGPAQLPTWKQIRSASRFTFIQRLQRTWQRNYTSSGWIAETLRNALGDPYRVYTRLWLQALPYLSIALIGEKDSYEPLQWYPARRYYGLDFISGHVALGRIGELERLILGDYILQVGQGLVFARGLGFGKGGDPILSLKQPSYGLVPYSSVNEYQFWRGAAATLRLSQRWALTAMASRLRQDGTVVSPSDTTEGAEGFVQTLLSSGLHRTPSEMARRGTFLQEAVGGVLAWRKTWNSAGVTFLHQHFAPALNLAGEPPYRYFGFVGRENAVGSIFWDVTWRNLNFFGEAAQSRSGGRAFVASLIAAVHPTLDIALQARRFDPNFHSFYAYTFAERPFSVQNEEGFYMGVRVRPSPRWELLAFHDLYRFPWYRYRASAPSEGQESLVQLTYTIRRRLMMYVRLRYETKAYNISSGFGEGEVHRLIPHTRAYVRYHFLYEVSPFWRYQARLEVSRYQREMRSGGYLVYQDLRWQPTFSWSISLRWVVYRITSYDARIYTYEAMPPTTFLIPGYYGEGQRVYVLIRWRVGRHWTIWLRADQNLFRPPQEKSFRQAVEGLLQVRYAF
ncbi:MAG: helix-hairpin-helix domain-containing protein [Bacteroidia bacterium]|nr:helix-hairpin-helix domain-containing protein [Bacteroidia bacterium]